MLSTKYFFKPIILGILIFLFGLGTLSDSFIGGLIFLLIGIGITAGSGIQTILRIEKAGTPYHISVPFFEKRKKCNY
jgi:hypothetical protein